MISEKDKTPRRLGLGLIALTGISIATMLLSRPEAALASVSLSSFDAFPEANRIVLHWETESEVDTLGFNIWRGTQCNAAAAARVNPSLIPATGQGAIGSSYDHADTDVEQGVLYDYRIEDVDNAGQATCHQEYPVQARLIDDNFIVTVTPNTDPSEGPTSTTAPTSTPAPTGTPALTNTPQPTGADSSATVPASPESTAEATAEQLPPPPPPESDAAPTATAAPLPTAEEELGIEAVATDTGGSDGEPDSPPSEVGAGAEDPQATADAQATAEAAGAEELTELAEAGDEAQTNTVGAGLDSGTSAQEVESRSSEDGSSSRNVVTIILVLIGGLFFTLGGIAAVWFFVINRNG